MARAAARRHHVLTTEHLLKLGMSRRQISRWEAAGRLHRKHRGVYAVGRADLDRQGVWQAALDAVGGDAALSHASAVEAWNWRSTCTIPVHVSTSRSGLRQRDGIVIHSVVPDAMKHNGQRVTRPARTLADVAPDEDDDGLLRLCSAAAYRRHFDARLLKAQLNRRPAGADRLRRVLRLLDAADGHTRSELELRFRKLIARHRIARPSFNEAIALPDGRTVIPDAIWWEHGLVIELDSRDAHDHEPGQLNDAEKNLIYAELGLECLRLRWRHVVDEEQRVADVLVARVGLR